MMNYFIHGAGLVLALILAFVSLALGVDWMTINHGLHPALASVIFVLSCTCAAWFISNLWDLWCDRSARRTYRETLRYLDPAGHNELYRWPGHWPDTIQVPHPGHCSS